MQATSAVYAAAEPTAAVRRLASDPSSELVSMLVVSVRSSVPSNSAKTVLVWARVATDGDAMLTGIFLQSNYKCVIRVSDDDQNLSPAHRH